MVVFGEVVLVASVVCRFKPALGLVLLRRSSSSLTLWASSSLVAALFVIVIGMEVLVVASRLKPAFGAWDVRALVCL